MAHKPLAARGLHFLCKEEDRGGRAERRPFLSEGGSATMCQDGFKERRGHFSEEKAETLSNLTARDVSSKR